MSRYGGYEDQPFLAEYYDYIPGYAGRPDLDFYLEYCRAAEGKILELGCGTGRVLIPAAAAGCRIVGLDLSEHMLAKCREKVAAQPEEVQRRIRLVQGNMARFALVEKFTLVTTPFRPFQHLLSVVDQMSCLRCVNAHLEIGGKLILDLFQVNPRMTYDPACLGEQEDFSGVRLPDGRVLSRTHRIAGFHRSEQYNDCELIFHVTHPDGGTERLVQAFPFRYFFRFEVEHLLARCGFRVVELFGNYDRSPFTDESPEMLFIAEKCEETGEDKLR